MTDEEKHKIMKEAFNAQNIRVYEYIRYSLLRSWRFATGAAIE